MRQIIVMVLAVASFIGTWAVPKENRQSKWANIIP